MQANEVAMEEVEMTQYNANNRTEQLQGSKLEQ